MADILFKRGTQAALDTLISQKKGVDGSFYLTVDDNNSSRLYVGRADGSIVPVNQGIYTVANTDALTNAVNGGKLHTGDFAYVQDGNILALYSHGGWIQINAAVDTFTSDLTFTASAEATGGVKVVLTGTDNNGTHGNNNGLVSDFTLKGEDGVNVSVEGTVITVKGDPDTLSSDAVRDNTTSIKLTGKSNAAHGSVKISAGDNVQITGTANNIVIASDDTKNASLGFKSLAAGFKATITDTAGTPVSGTVDPILKYGDTDKEAHFVSGTASLDVYSKEDIDKKLRSLDGMTYRGTVGAGGSAATSVNALTNVHIGDTFRASSDFDLPAAQNANNSATGATAVKTGDLLIAVGTENNQGILTNPKYDIITSGDDIEDTTYTTTAITNGLQIEDSLGSKIGSLALSKGTGITLTPSTGANNAVSVQVGLSDVARTDTTAAATSQTATQNLEFTVVSGVSTNGQGQITGVETQKITVVDSSSTVESVAYTAAAADNKATITNTVATVDAGGVSTSKSGTFALSSSNLTVSRVGTTGAEVKVNFEWGTF